MKAVAKTTSSRSKLTGIFPPMTTPFKKNGDLDLRLVKGQVDWMIGEGVHGVVAGGSTGEGHTLDAEETRDLVAATTEAVAGRVPVIAGIIVDSTREAIKRGKLLGGLQVAALQVTPVHYLFRPDDNSMQEHFRVVANETNLPLIIYNVVPWCYISPDQLIKIMREVSTVIGVKQSAGDLKLFADLMLAPLDGKLIYSAIDPLLYPSFALGAHGAISALLAAVPGPTVELWNAVQKGDHPRALSLHRKLLLLWNAIFSPNRPACIRFAQEVHGCVAGHPRAPMPAASEEQQRTIKAVLMKEFGLR